VDHLLTVGNSLSYRSRVVGVDNESQTSGFGSQKITMPNSTVRNRTQRSGRAN